MTSRRETIIFGHPFMRGAVTKRCLVRQKTFPRRFALAVDTGRGFGHHIRKGLTAIAP
jgi:hypothetical protein